MTAFENSRSLPGPVGESLAANSSAGEPSAPSKSNPTPQAFLSPDKTTARSRLSRYGMTCEPLTAGRGEELLTWFRAGFRVRTSALPEQEKDSTASVAGFGEKWRELLAKWDQDTFSWKTPQCLFQEDSTKFSVILPQWGIMLNGEIFPVTKCKTHNRDKGFLSLPTLCATECKDSSKASILAKSDRGGRVARRLCALSEKTRSLQEIVTLNPCFGEWMMGWPIGYTGLKPLETGRFQTWLNSHGKPSSPDNHA